jgi:hypothetical protein
VKGFVAVRDGVVCVKEAVATKGQDGSGPQAVERQIAAIDEATRSHEASQKLMPHLFN